MGKENMKKICILSTVNIKHMTLISLYTIHLEKAGIPYDIIYIDKYGSEESISAQNKYVYRLNIRREWSFLRKLSYYWRFKSFAEKIIKENQYDFIIVWNGFTAFMFSGFLSRNFAGKYCLNLRDYDYEKIFLVYLKIRRAVASSAYTTISSDGFRSFLPPHDYVNVHSLNRKILNNCHTKERLRERGDRIRVSFIGYVRFFENDKKLIDSLGNDSRFTVQFFGEGVESLERYALEKGYDNVLFMGRFEPERTAEFLLMTDVINNLYGVGDIALDTALSIKLYYSIYLRMPILVFKDTYMAEVTEKYGLGFSLGKDGYDKLADSLYDWYHNLNFKKFSAGCEKFLGVIEKQNRQFDEYFDRYISG
jgi:hypothetical protein